MSRPQEVKTVAEAAIKLCESFKKYVELNEGYQLLRDSDDKPRPEKAAQLLFLGLAKKWLELLDIDVSKEVNIGRGPVDFKLSRGAVEKVLIEMKLAKNSKLIKGNSIQLTEYLKAENVDIGIYLVIYFSDEEKVLLNNAIPNIESFNKSLGDRRMLIIVDARSNRPSASKM